MSMYILGVDAGGTKTHAIICNEKNECIAEYITGPGNYKTVGTEAVSENIKTAITECINQLKKKENSDQINSACIGIASLDTPHDREVLNECIQKAINNFSIERCKLVNDAKIALYSGTSKKESLVVIAGTGSHCYGVSEQNKEFNISGLDYILSDEGSGYMMGAKALRAAVQSMDGRIDPSIIEALVMSELRIGSMREAKDIVSSSQFNKAKIAGLAKIVFNAARQQDVTARRIIDETVSELYAMVRVGITKLGYVDTDIDLVCTGGLFKNDEIKTPFLEIVNKKHKPVTCIFPTNDPVWGAIQIASEKISKSK